MLYELGDRRIRIQRFMAMGVPCVKETMIPAKTHTKRPSRVLYYVDTAALWPMTHRQHRMLSRSAGDLPTLLDLLENP